MERLAVISDVHGNLTAFEAVLADITARGVTRILNLGDNVGKGPRGSEVIDLCRELCEVNVRGNWDDVVGDLEHPNARYYAWWREQLRPEQLGWLARLPLSHDLLIGVRRVRLFHASATSVYTRVHLDHTDEEFAQMFARTELTGPGPAPDVVGYGDIHSAYLEVRADRTLFNAGSVGNPLDEATASYVLVEGAAGSGAPEPFSVQIVRVPYDVETELAAARRLGMPELEYYEVELR